MERKSVKSSNIKSVGYSKAAKVLEVEFNHGGVYCYEDVPENAAVAMVKAPSIGKFFSANIKNGFKFKKGEYTEMTKVPNIYICGKAGAGKTFTANHLIKEFGSIQAKFAFPVYGLAYDYFKMDKKDRNLLQVVGTDCGRDLIDSDIWVNRFVEDTKIVQLARQKLGLPAVGLVCDDCRFENEHAILKRNGWVGIHLAVSDEVRIERLGKRDGNAQVGTLNHASEVSVDVFKDELIQIDASGTVQDTFDRVDAMIDEIRKGNKVNG
jgi:hypothetical protein